MLPDPHRRRIDLPLALAAVFAMLWAVARASVQSITLDEADTYLSFVGRPAPFHWWPFPNNQILNSALMRMFTLIFGVSHLTVRLPALIGTAIYIAVCWYLCALLPARFALRFPLFLCLVYNPFVFDFLVAARGYSWAMALLLCVVAVPAAGLSRPASTAKLCAGCSALAALSFTSNFSFAFADFAVLLLALLWIWRERGFSLRSLAAAIVPGVLVIVMLPLPILLRFPREQLYAGATSLRQSFASIIHWSLYEINPEVATPLMVWMMQRLEHRLFPLLGLVVAWRLALLLLNREKPAQEQTIHEQTRWLKSLAAVLAGAAAIATMLHWVAFHAFGLLLPLDRTGLFYVPLCTLAFGAMVAIPLESRMGRASGYAGLAVLTLFALHFMYSMRLTYFAEWRYDADMKKVYTALAGYNHEYCVDRVESDWFYTNSLNFYRVLSGRESFAEFPHAFFLPEDAQVYVLEANIDGKFIDEQKLMVVFHGESTDAVIAVRPGLAPCRE
jgi:hypothetical protein